MTAHEGDDQGSRPGQNGTNEGADEVRRLRLLALLDGDGLDRDRAERSPIEATGVVSEGPARRDGLLGLRDRLRRVCVVTASEVGVDGAGVTVMSSVDAGLAGHRDQVIAVGALTSHLEELQLTTGEGPCLDAYSTGLPVLAGDVAAEATRWQGFGPEAVTIGAAALFSLPLQVGVVRLGTLDLNRLSAGPLSRDQLADALALAVVATEVLLELAELAESSTDDPDSGDDPEAHQRQSAGWLPDVHADVHVASGMLSAQTGVGVGAALIRIRAHAFASGESIHEIARRIIDRTLILGDHRTEQADTHDDGPPAPNPENDDP